MVRSMTKTFIIRFPNDSLHTRLKKELEEWRKIRGPKFSLNDLVIEKLAASLQATPWPVAIKEDQLDETKEIVP